MIVVEVSIKRYVKDQFEPVSEMSSSCQAEDDADYCDIMSCVRIAADLAFKEDM